MVDELEMHVASVLLAVFLLGIQGDTRKLLIMLLSAQTVGQLRLSLAILVKGDERQPKQCF